MSMQILYSSIRLDITQDLIQMLQHPMTAVKLKLCGNCVWLRMIKDRGSSLAMVLQIYKPVRLLIYV